VLVRPSLHDWIVAPYRRDRDAAHDRFGRDRYDIDAHRNHRGPYTAAGELVRQVVASAYRLAPDLVLAHQLTLLSVAPELRDRVPVSDEVAKSFTFSREGNARSWTLRLAHGLTGFLLAFLGRTRAFPCSISFEHVDLADPLDCEFIAVLLRRSDPEQLLVRVCTSLERLDDPLLAALKTHARVTHMEPAPAAAVPRVPDVWRAWLEQRALGWREEWRLLRDLSEHLDLTEILPPTSSIDESLDDVIARLSPSARTTLATEYVDSDCTSDRLLARHAYSRMSAPGRRELHVARAASLGRLGQPSVSLGAIPFHYEQAAVDADPLLAASSACMRLGYYDGALDWAVRGRRMIDRVKSCKAYGEFTRNMLFSLLLLGRLDEVEIACRECQSVSDDPALLAHAAYAIAILNARLYDPARRDYDAAKVWVETSLAFTERLPPSATRAVNIAFLRNTMALVEMRQGRQSVAIQLLSDAMEYLAKEAPERYEMESTILLHNRARVYVAINQLDKAVADLTTLLGHEPSNSEAHFDRGVLHQRSGRYEMALSDYDEAIRWSPPYDEPYFNRAQTLAALGRQDEALAAYSDVLALEPDLVEARINRACLLYERREFDASRTDVDHARRLSPMNARLLCLYGLLEANAGHLDTAYRAFTDAIERDGALPDAWANRANVLFKRGDPEAALRDLTEALHLREDVTVLYNRGRVLESQKRWHDAAADYSRALALAGAAGSAGGDLSHILRHRGLCYQAMGSTDPASPTVVEETSR
jgi:tetratricopeptide (TPR) repeat protein